MMKNVHVEAATIHTPLAIVLKKKVIKCKCDASHENAAAVPMSYQSLNTYTRNTARCVNVAGTIRKGVCERWETIED